MSTEDNGAFITSVTEDRIHRARTPLFTPGERGVARHRPNSNAVEVEGFVLSGDVLDAFLERLVQVMIAAPEDGADTATRAYAVLRPIQVQLRKGLLCGRLSTTPAGARAVRAELRLYLGDPKTRVTTTPLDTLYNAVHRSLKGKEKGATPR